MKSRVAILITALAILLTLMPVAASAATGEEPNIRKTDVETASSGYVLVYCEGEFKYLSKDTILDRINEIRYEACEEGVLYPGSETRHLTLDDYVPVKWSSDLEWIAQTRAAEATIHMDHVRPNGKRWNGVYHNGIKSSTEDIAWNGTANILGGIEQWYGEKSDWVEQTEGAVTGHYTSMINPRYNYVGIGAFKPSDTKARFGAVAGEFSNLTGLDESQNGAQGTYLQIIEVNKSKLSVSAKSPVTIHIGKKEELTLNASTTYENDLGSYYSPMVANVMLIKDQLGWESEDTTVVTVSDDGEATGVKAGSATVNATYDGTSYPFAVTIEDHQWNEGATIAATCSKEGSVTYTCSVCGEEKTNTIPIDTDAHDWGEWTETTPATCVAGGVETRTCNHNATHKETRDTEPKQDAHSWGAWEQTKAPTCTAVGEETRTCEYDSTHQQKRDIDIDKDAHSWGEWTETTPATCVAGGVETRICKHDATHKETRDTEPRQDAHDWGEWTETTPATCVAGGVETRTCKHDATHKETRDTEPRQDAHDWGEWIETTPATCVAGGVETRTCNHDATHKETRDTEPKQDAHSWGEWAKINDEQHQRICSNNASHKQTEDHSWGEGVVTTPASETEDGVKTFTCSVCYATKTEAIPSQLNQAKQDALARLEQVNLNNYSGAEKTNVENALKAAREAIENATSVSEVTNAENIANSTIKAQKTNAQKDAEAKQKTKPATKPEIVDLKAVKGLKLKAGKGKITVKWKKAKRKELKTFQGYEIQYTLNGTFKDYPTKKVGKKKASVTLKKLLKKKKYKVRIRRYRDDGKVLHVSSWKMKKVKTKK